MTDIVLDTDGDIDVTDFTSPRLFSASEALKAIGQHVLIRLRTFQGEWFLDTIEGVPYFQQILGVKNGEGVALGLIRQRILDTPGVTSVATIAVELDSDRTLQVSFTAMTDAGTLSLTTALATA